MITFDDLKLLMDKITVPAVKRSLTAMNLIKDVRTDGNIVTITLSNAALRNDAKEWLRDKIKDTLKKTDGVKEVDINYVDAKPKDLNKIRRVIAVMSGKGGVGKSVVSSLIAIALRRQGNDVGILDADITGPSIPKMFGIKGSLSIADNGILPMPSETGIEVMSINLLLPTENDAVIWRGPLIGRTITQFWEEVLWGTLDYLIIDLPPGTADAPLTVMQQLPIAGIIIVFTPQDLTAMVVRKAINMAKKMEKPILGVVENMSYLYIPEINKKMEIFGKSKAEEMAKAAESPLLGQLPIDPFLVHLCDKGEIEQYDAAAYDTFIENIAGILGKKQ